MKNQYFGDVNDYRKYGLLRTLAANSGLRIGVCWMLTDPDGRDEGNKIEYLDKSNESIWSQFDPCLYEFLQRKVNGHESEEASRNISHFDEGQLPNAVFWNAILRDNKGERGEYFNQMRKQFGSDKVELIFFDPDNGLAKEPESETPRSNSCKLLLHKEVHESYKQKMSVLVYQHFDRTNRETFIQQRADELMNLVNARGVFSFSTPHVVFFLVPRLVHWDLLSGAVQAVRDSRWSAENSCKTSATTEKRQVLVKEWPRDK